MPRAGLSRHRFPLKHLPVAAGYAPIHDVAMTCPTCGADTLACAIPAYLDGAVRPVWCIPCSCSPCPCPACQPEEAA